MIPTYKIEDVEKEFYNQVDLEELIEEVEGEKFDSVPTNGNLLTYKMCNGCNENRPYSQFYKNETKADGYSGRCKNCNKIQNKERNKRKK